MKWKEMHEEMGCYRCKFADKNELGKGPCCTDRPEVNQENVCVRRQGHGKFTPRRSMVKIVNSTPESR